MTTVEEQLEWHAQRRTGIGGSDIAAILGLSPWTGPYGVWAEKVGEVEPDLSESEYMEFGKRAEAMFGGYVLDRTGLFLLHEQVMLTDAEVPHFRCSLDGALAESPSSALSECVSIFEGKTTDDREWGEDGIPIAYRCQGQWNMMIAGLPVCTFGVLHGRKFRLYELEADADDQAFMRAEAHAFWEYVVARTAPPTDATPGTTDAIKRRWSKANVGEEVALEEWAANAVGELRQVKSTIASLKKRETFLANIVTDAMGEATEGLIDGELAVTWRAQTTNRVDTKRLRAEHPDIAEVVTVSSSHRVLLPKNPTTTTEET